MSLIVLKKQIIEELENANEHTLLQVKDLLNPSLISFSELPQFAQQDIELGLQQVNSEETIAYEVFKEKYRK